MPSLTSATAAANNAAWCDAICRAHGCRTDFADGLWVNRDPPPPFHPNVVSIGRGDSAAQIGHIRALREAGLPRPWSVKDSFCTLDLGPLGFEVLFEAEWLGLRPDESLPVGDPAAAAWTAVASGSELAEWEAVWSGESTSPREDPSRTRIFPTALLEDPEVVFLAAKRGGRVVAGLAANRSGGESGAVAGVSNIFLSEKGGERDRPGALAAVRTVFPGAPIVGYERGADLVAMRELGFTSLGRLRVWVTEGGTPAG